ncbi:unnamed protein product [Burkholderia pseudomallei]|nr:unnamed protein product [Burkholderia pseudomallei]
MTPTLDETALPPADALAYPGTLLSPDGRLVAPYDLERPGADARGHVGAAARAGLLHAASGPFTLDYATLSTVHVINGMGVALGDSVVGLTALAAIKARHPHVHFVLYRPAHAPAYVDALYRLAADAIAPIRALPWPAAELPARDTRIDLGNHLYWPAFAARPMIDFFLASLGVPPESIPADAKCNRWLARLTLPRCRPSGATGRTRCSARRRARRCAASRPRNARRSSSGSRAPIGCPCSASGRSIIRTMST